MFFGRKKKKEKELDAAFQKVTKEINSIDSFADPKKLEYYILDSCEQIIATTKEIEAEKSEYRMLTAYLKDVTTMSELSEEESKTLREVAMNIRDLNKAKVAYQSATRKISDEQFIVMEQDEDAVPLAIKRMQENEIYQAKVKRDMNFAEARKSEYEMDREDMLNSQKILKKASILLLIAFVSFMILILVIQTSTKQDMQVAYLAVFAFGAILGFSAFLRLSYIHRNMKKTVYKMNEAILTLNRIRMKYATVTNAIEYTKERYFVTNSYELNYTWEQYLEAVSEKQKYLRNNDDLEYFTGRLMRLLQKIDLYDRKIWLERIDAIIDKKEMVEVKHRLIKRRQKVREQIESNTRSVRSERNEIDRIMTEHRHYVPEIYEIIKSVDKLCGTSQNP